MLNFNLMKNLGNFFITLPKMTDDEPTEYNIINAGNKIEKFDILDVKMLYFVNEDVEKLNKLAKKEKKDKLNSEPNAEITNMVNKILNKIKRHFLVPIYDGEKIGKYNLFNCLDGGFDDAPSEELIKKDKSKHIVKNQNIYSLHNGK